MHTRFGLWSMVVLLVAGCSDAGLSPQSEPIGRSAALSPNDATYGGGPVLSSVRVVSVFWGRNLDPAITSVMGGFYGALTNSPFMDWLREYNTPTQAIGRGSFAGNFSIIPNNGATVLSESMIVNELAGQINGGQLPVPDANTLYMVHFPYGITLTLDGGGQSCVNFCAYHSYGNVTINGHFTNIVYGALPYQIPGCTTFGTGNTPAPCGDRAMIDNYTGVASHELAEATTDPQSSGWYPEIGDSCTYRALQSDAAFATLVAPNGTGYTVQTEWSNLDEGCVSGFEVADEALGQNADGRLELFYIRTDGALYHKWQTTPNGSWGTEVPLGGAAKKVAVGSNADGRLELFYIGTNDALYHNAQVAANGPWGGEASLGGFAKQITVGRNLDGRLELFYIGTNDAIYHNWQTTPGGSWQGEAALPGSAKQLTVAQNPDGRLEIFYTNLSDAIYHEWQLSTTPGHGWSGQNSLGGFAQQLVVGRNQDGRLEVVYVGTDTALYHNWQLSSTPGQGWNGEASFGGFAKKIAIGRNTDGRLELVYIGTDDALYHNSQNAANSWWNGEAALGGFAKLIALGQDLDGRLELVYVGTNNALYRNGESTPSGAWVGESVF